MRREPAVWNSAALLRPASLAPRPNSSALVASMPSQCCSWASRAGFSVSSGMRHLGAAAVLGLHGRRGLVEAIIPAGGLAREEVHMDLVGKAKRVRVYVGEVEKIGHRPAAAAIVEWLRGGAAQGAPLIR